MIKYNSSTGKWEVKNPKNVNFGKYTDRSEIPDTVKDYRNP